MRSFSKNHTRKKGLIFGVLTPSYTTVGNSCVCTLLLAFLLTRPIRRLRWATQQIAAGKLDMRANWGRDPKKGLLSGHDDINGLIHDFNHMAARLQTLVAAQHMLLRDVSHEVRSPLTRLGVALELARQNYPYEMHHHLDRIARESDRINALVGELLTLSFMESMESITQPMLVSLNELLGKVVRDACYEAQTSRRIVANISTPICHVLGDMTLLRRALENILRNAIHYSPEGEVVDVGLVMNAHEGRQMALIQVKDNGRGVPPEELESILLPFYRVDKSRNLFTGGFGVGLSIAARTVDLHCGVIAAWVRRRSLP
jgi:two-component system, OmpR family, sensor histidine kinase CpxA